MGIRTRRAHMHSRTHVVGFGIAGVFGFIALLFVTLAISLGAMVSNWLQSLPDYSSANAYLVAEPTTVYAADGSTIAEYYLQNRRSVDLDQISKYVLQATVDTEDRRFYQHNGVDPQGILRAVVAQLGGGSEGASTITQQLVRNTVLSDEQFEQTIKRKVREAYIAIQMEKMYSKDQILNMYLNTIYYGHSAYGIEAASTTYFNKHASDLTLAEAATLAGLPQSPSAYDPFSNPEAATARRNTVLDHMLNEGDISQEDHDAAVSEELTLNEGSFSETAANYPYFTDYVKQLLLEDFDQDTVMQGGLKVYTTLDPSKQAAAEDAVQSRLESIGNDRLDAALCAVDPSTGYIVAMVGGRDYSENQFNLATQARRQPGSSFKIFTLAAALNAGMNPSVLINCNSPMQFTPTWKVQNFGNESYGTLSLANAFAISSNTGFVQVIEAVGADKVVSMAKAMGIDVDLPAYESITLGTEGVPPVQMAEAYATIASGGVHRDAIAITKIEDRNGNTVYEHQDSPTQVIEPSVAQDIRKVTQGVTRSGGTASVVGYTMSANQPVGGKTGTSENYRDLWFCGITPQLSVAVWCGYQEEAPVIVGGSYGHPYNTAVPIFVSFVNQALDGVDRAEFPSVTTSPTYKENSSWKFSKTNEYTNGNYYYYETVEDDEEETQVDEETQRQTRERTRDESESGGGTQATPGASTGGTSGASTGGTSGTGESTPPAETAGGGGSTTE